MGYDVRGRRITKAVANTGSWDCAYNYYHDADSVVEEQNGSAQTIKQYVWGQTYIDELIQTSLNSNPTSQSTCDTPYWAEQDANWNVLGIVNGSGVLTERYEYSAYGQRTPYISAGSNDPFCTAATIASTRFTAGGTIEPWAICEIGHQGLVHDEENYLVYNRARYLSTSLGRLMTRDPAGYADSFSLYSYCNVHPTEIQDPTGLWIELPDPGHHKTLDGPVDGYFGGVAGWIGGGVPGLNNTFLFGPNAIAYIEQNANVDAILTMAARSVCCSTSTTTITYTGQTSWKIQRVGNMSNLTGGSVGVDYYKAVCKISTTPASNGCCNVTVHATIVADISKLYNFVGKGWFFEVTTNPITIYGHVLFDRTSTMLHCP
jgi:RHS repeat-associated protein